MPTSWPASRAETTPTRRRLRCLTASRRDNGNLAGQINGLAGDRVVTTPCLAFDSGLCSSRRIPPARESFHIGEQIAQASICDISDPRKGAQKAVGARQLK